MKRPPKRAAKSLKAPARRVRTEEEVAAAMARIPVVRDVTWEQIRAETREE